MADEVYDLEADVEFQDTDPNNWRNMPVPDGDENDDDDDTPAPDYVKSVLGLDPAELFGKEE